MDIPGNNGYRTKAMCSLGSNSTWLKIQSRSFLIRLSSPRIRMRPRQQPGDSGAGVSVFCVKFNSGRKEKTSSEERKDENLIRSTPLMNLFLYFVFLLRGRFASSRPSRSIVITITNRTACLGSISRSLFASIRVSRVYFRGYRNSSTETSN